VGADLVCAGLWLLLVLRVFRALRSGSQLAAGTGPLPAAAGLGPALAAAAARLAILAAARATPLVDHPVLDARFYRSWALALAGGTDPCPVFPVDPLPAYVLGGLYRLIGDGAWIGAATGCAIGALTVYYVYRLARRLAGPAVALLAATAAALHGPGLALDILELKSSLACCLTAATLEALLAAHGRPPARVAASGALAGLAVLNGMQSLVLVALLAASLARRDRPVARLLVFLAATGTCVAPAWLHNRAGGDACLVHAGSGMILWAANNPHAAGRLFPLPYVRQDARFEVRDYVEAARRALGRPVTAGEASAHFRDLAIGFWLSDPLRALRLVAVKLGLLLNRYEWPDNHDHAVVRLLVPALDLPLPHWGIVTPLALVGAAIALAGGPAGARLIALAAMSLAIPLVVAYSNSRLRLSLLAVLWPLAALAVAAIARSSARRRRLALAAAWAALAAAVHVPVERVPLAPGLFALADATLRTGDAGRAAALYRIIVALDPAHAGALVNLGNMHVLAGDHAGAAALFARAVEARPDVAAWWHNLGNAYRRSGRPWEAVSAYGRARALSPGEPVVTLKLGLALDESGSPDGARLLLAEALAALAGGAPATGIPASPGERAEGHEALARILARYGDAAGSRRERERASTLARDAGRPPEAPR
jgi:tetratricopeptide (TPR) repeat protein